MYRASDNADSGEGSYTVTPTGNGFVLEMLYTGKFSGDMDVYDLTVESPHSIRFTGTIKFGPQTAAAAGRFTRR